MSLIYLALGSNQPHDIYGDSVALCEHAIRELNHLCNSSVRQISSFYRSKPMQLEHLEYKKQADYVNAVVALDTTIPPVELLNALQAIEHRLGRVREERWGARTLDIDILLYDDIIVETERLTIPHYGIYLRSFVLIPLLEIAPALVFPDGQRLTEVIETLSMKEKEALILINK